LIQELKPRRRPGFWRNIAAAVLAILGFSTAILLSLFRK
jgi:hypothetical protein